MATGGGWIERCGASRLLPLFAIVGTALLLAQSPTAAMSAAAVALLVAASATGMTRDLVVVSAAAGVVALRVRKVRHTLSRQCSADSPGRPGKPRAPGACPAAVLP